MIADPLDRLELIGQSKDDIKRLCDQLSDMPLFSDMQWPELESVAHFLKVYRANSGTSVFKEGEPGNFMCILLEGRVDVLKEDQDLVQKTVATILPGRMFGEMAIIDGERRSASCVAEGDVEVAVMTKLGLEDLVHQHPLLGAKLLHHIARLLSQRLRHVSGMLVDYLDH